MPWCGACCLAGYERLGAHTHFHEGLVRCLRSESQGGGPYSGTRLFAPSVCFLPGGELWIHDPAVICLTAGILPRNIAGGSPGSLGPEVMAAIVDAELESRGSGVSLDFKHAFDCESFEGCIVASCTELLEPMDLHDHNLLAKPSTLVRVQRPCPFCPFDLWETRPRLSIWFLC